MANSKSNTVVNPADSKRAIDGTKLFLIIFAVIALIGIITAAVFGVISAFGKRTLDYEKARLSKYISIDPSEYKSFDVLLNLDRLVDDEGNDTEYFKLAVQNEILKLLYSNRKATDNKNKIGQTVKAGDTANIYYYGYTLDEDGKKVPFSGGSNFSDKVTSLGIGSGSMIVGFELALVGKNSNDYRTMTKHTEGTVQDGQLVTITYTAAYFDGSVEKNATTTVDLSEDVDAKWGEGFKDYLLGATIGATISENLTVDRTGSDGITRTDIYSSVKVVNAIEFGEGEPLTIDVTFPRPYSSADLEGKAVKFDIYIVTSVSYDTPEFNDVFITETLGVKAEDLAEYGDENSSLTEKYTEKIRADLLEEHRLEVNSLIETEMWEYYHRIVKVKKLPKADVSLFYSNYESEINSYYSSYSSYYSSFDQAARDYLQIGSTADWRAALTEKAEQAVTEKLIFYYIARNEGLMPDEQTKGVIYDEMFDEMLDAYLEQYKVDRDNYDTEEEYNKQVEYYKSVILTQYGEDYITENALFEYIMETFLTYARVTYAE